MGRGMRRAGMRRMIEWRAEACLGGEGERVSMVSGVNLYL